MGKPICYLKALALLLLTVGLFLPAAVGASPSTQTQIITPAELILVVNGLRASYGLPALSVHPILMQTAQSQADYMAATGNVTHTRPGGISYTQQLLSLGFPLAGDLSRGGFRAENIIYSNGYLNWDGVPPGWQDAAHMNTMLSQNFTHIGAGISQGTNNSFYYAVDTAAVTNSGQMQDSAGDILTSVPGGPGSVADASQFMVPVSVSTARPDGDVFHQVQYGQSLWSIAITYGTTIKNIQALNNLGDDLIVYQGQELLVLKAATQPAPVAAEVTAATLQPTEIVPPTMTTSVTATVMQMAVVPTVGAVDANASQPPSSRVLVIVLIIAAFVGAGMAVWLIRDPGSS